MTTPKQTEYEGMFAETIRFPGHDRELIGGYMARPLGPGPFPGVIVIHEAFGLVPHTKELVRKFAEHGYLTIAPDLYWREGMGDPADIRAVVQRMGAVPDTRAIGDLEGTAHFLHSLPTSNGRLGCIGHCSGGRHSLLFACNTTSLNAAVNCYGGRVIPDELTPSMPTAVVDMIPKLSCPLLGLFGEADGNPNPEQISQIEEQLTQYNKEYDFTTYPAPVGHGFFADYRPSYNQEAATDGWTRIVSFFDQHLNN